LNDEIANVGRRGSHRRCGNPEFGLTGVFPDQSQAELIIPEEPFADLERVCAILAGEGRQGIDRLFFERNTDSVFS